MKQKLENSKHIKMGDIVFLVDSRNILFKTGGDVYNNVIVFVLLLIIKIKIFQISRVC
jgi:hypothetical protein